MREVERPGELARAESLLARALLATAALAFGAACFWEIGAPFGAGHYAAASAVGAAGENMWRLGTAFPVVNQASGPLTVDDYYTHHPFGIFWVQALFSAAFGKHDWVCRAPAVLQGALTPLLVYAVARPLYGALPAALGAFAFVVTPIALAFGNFNGLEVPVIFASLLASWAVLRLHAGGGRRHLFGGLAALAFALNADWPAFVFSAGLVGIIAGWALVTREHRRRRQLLQFAKLAAALTLAIGAAYLIVLTALGELDDLLAQGHARALGSENLFQAVYARRYWIVLMFTPLAIALGVLALPVIVVRATASRNPLELLPVAFLVTALFQYLVFKQGADVHIFWPHYFAPYFALAFAAVVRASVDLSERAAPRARTAVFALALLVPAIMAPDALRTLVYARKTGGRFNERGNFIQPDKDKVAALAELSRTLPPTATVALAANMRQSLWVPWVLERPARTSGTLDAFPESYFITDARFESPGALSRAAARGRVRAIGPFWVVSREPTPGLIAASSMERREPSLFERLWLSSTHAPRAVSPSPFLTWELRHHLGQSPNPWTATPPSGFEALRIAHNAAVSHNDPASARSLLARLLHGVDKRAQREYADGTRLLGVRFERGASDVLTVYIQAARSRNSRFVVRSRVQARAPFSTVPKDDLVWRVGLPPSIPEPLWRPGYVYSSVTEILRRPGREVYTGRWESTSRTHSMDAGSDTEPVTLLEL